MAQLSREAQEKRVKAWVREHHGVLTKIAKETNKSLAFVWRVAYAREAQSKGLLIENKLQAMGCPMIQKIR